MTRHGRNCTASAVYSYHEKKKDTKTSGYGSQSERLSKDAIKEFDCCGLTLQPCRDPVITPDGYLYDREAILEYILHKKQEYSKMLRLYEKQVNVAKNKIVECFTRITYTSDKYRQVYTVIIRVLLLNELVDGKYLIINDKSPIQSNPKIKYFYIK